MTRVAVIPALTDGRAGLWSVARSEGRIPLNWGGLLAESGYEVSAVNVWRTESDPCPIDRVRLCNCDEADECDWALYGTTSGRRMDWYGVTSVRRRRTIRLQWPTGQGGGYDLSGVNVLAVVHPSLIDQVACEAGVSRDRIHVLPSPILNLDWWQHAANLPLTPFPERKFVMWAAREAFGNGNGGSQASFGNALLSALERRGGDLRPFVLSAEQYDPGYGPMAAQHRARERFSALRAEFTSGLHLGSTLAAMRASVIAVTQPFIMGPTLTEAIFEDCAPLVWSRYRALFPDLVDAASKHGVLLTDESSVGQTIDRLIDDWQMRARYIDSCKFAFAENSPTKAVEAWRKMEERFG